MTGEPDAIQDITSSRFEELTTALQDTEEFVASLQAMEATRKQVQTARLTATQAKYQSAMNTVAQTRGQIAILSEQLVAQETECHRLAGIVEYLQYLPD